MAEPTGPARIGPYQCPRCGEFDGGPGACRPGKCLSFPEEVSETAYHDAHIVMKQRHGGDRDGEVSYYVVGPVRETLEEAKLDLENFLALTEDG